MQTLGKLFAEFAIEMNICKHLSFAKLKIILTFASIQDIISLHKTCETVALYACSNSSN